MQGGCDFLSFYFYIFFGEWLFADFHLENFSLDEILTEDGKYLIGMTLPYIQCAPDVVVVESEIVLESFVVNEEKVAVDAVIEEIVEGRG